MKRRKVISFDLETIADPKMLEILPEVKPKGNLKDPEKIAADIAQKEEDQIKEMGLNPLLNMICCAGWCDENGTGSLSITDTEYQSEKDLLLKFWDVLSKYDTFITFNGRHFDLRCMLIHGITHGIRPAINIDKSKYNHGNHIDLRQVLAGPDMFAKGKLDFFCMKFLDDHKTDGIDGKQVQSYFDMGLHDDISKYCEKDASLTYRLYEKVLISGLLD